MIKTIKVEEPEIASIPPQEEYTLPAALPELTPVTLTVASRSGSHKQRLKPGSREWWGFCLLQGGVAALFIWFGLGWLEHTNTGWLKERLVNSFMHPTIMFLSVESAWALGKRIENMIRGKAVD